jgi:hypothetical protein
MRASRASKCNPLFSFEIADENIFSEINEILKPLDAAVAPLIKELTQNFDTGFAALMLLDNYSTRQYLMTEADP